ncbi:MAG: hypothetical protein DRH26_05980 [Deltaproteobacteria bacterium]|nr:MAG: hypothetical protein DRH26_05980 [Deltaproteobacteria bacterium]
MVKDNNKVIDKSKIKQKKRLCFFIFFLSLLVSQTVYGKADLTTIRQKNLDVQPLDVASSEDGNMIFILSLKELIIYSSETDQIISRSALDSAYDNISYSEKNKTLILTGKSSKSLRIIRVEQIHDISLSGLPFKGPSDAAVTLAVFDDYQ